MISKFKQVFVIGLSALICNAFAQNTFAQVTDYRDPFLGLYHTATPPCNNGNELTPPNHYIYIEKDTNNSTDIFATDTMWGQVNYLYRHPCTLNEADSTYVDGAQLGKFIPTDSLKVIGNACGFGYNYYLH